MIECGFLVYAPTQVDGLKFCIVRAAKGAKTWPNPLLQGFALGDEIDERRADKYLEDPGLFHFAVGTALTRNRAVIASDSAPHMLHLLRAASGQTRRAVTMCLKM